jgi:hypothetical protein
MIFRESVPKPTVNRHRAPWAVFSKRFLEVTGRQEPPPNVMDRHPSGSTSGHIPTVAGYYWKARTAKMA